MPRGPGIGGTWGAAVQVALLFAAVLLLGPVLAKPIARFIGAPVQLLRGVPGTMARGNVQRNPRRTARTAAPVLIGVALVATPEGSRLEIALAGDSFWDRCKLALAPSEDKAFREQVRAFDRYLQFTRQFGRAARVVDVAMGEQHEIDLAPARTEFGQRAFDVSAGTQPDDLSIYDVAHARALALMRAGVPESAIRSGSLGEENLPVPTADQVPERLNRSVHITVSGRPLMSDKDYCAALARKWRSYARTDASGPVPQAIAQFEKPHPILVRHDLARLVDDLFDQIVRPLGAFVLEHAVDRV